MEPERRELRSRLDCRMPDFWTRRVYSFCIGAALIDWVGGTVAALGLK